MAGSPLLVLGGTAEARELADRLHHIPGCDVTTSLAGVTRDPRRPAGGLRVGGFGGVEGLTRYLARTGTGAMIDATHPWAVVMSRNAAEAGRRAGVPVLHLVRPAWERRDTDRWHEVENASAAARWLDRSGLPPGSVVFLTVARAEHAAFAGLPRFRYIVRTIEPVTCGPLAAETVHARGPFSRAGETAFMRERDVACLVTRNAGGAASVAKIEAARDLGLPVVMLERPAAPEGETVASVDAALAWARRVVREGHSRVGRSR